MDTRYPTLISTSPKNYELNVEINTSFRMEFSIDLDSRYITNSVHLATSTGEIVGIRTSYKSKVITITPLESLTKNTTYQLTLQGDSNLEDSKKEGIRSIIGDCMSGNYTVTFTTEVDESLVPPAISFPPYGVVIKEKPVFIWEDPTGNGRFNVELSTSKSFSTLVYPTIEDQVIAGSTLNIADDLEDGIYYFRVRYVGGNWSQIHQFNLDSLTEGNIAEDDAPSINDEFPMYDEMPIELELIDSFPKDLELLVSTKVKSLYFRVIGDIDISLLDTDSFRLEGTHISGDYEEESHGEVSGSTTIVEDTDGTSYIVFTPKPLLTEEVGE